MPTLPRWLSEDRTMTDLMPMSQPLVSIKKVETRSARVASSTLNFWSDSMKHAGELCPLPLSGMI